MDTIAEAMRARDARQLDSAAMLLEAYLDSHPRHAEAMRLLAQTLYWLGEARSARERYEAALRFPDAGVALRLEYARMLAETGAYRRAREVLSPIETNPAAAGEVESLLGTMAYWSGDYSSAVRLLREALRLDPGDDAARRQLEEIGTATAPVIQLSSDGIRDDQPVRRIGGGVDASWFLTPLTSVGFDLSSAWAGGTRSHLAISTAALRFDGYLPGSRLEWRLGAGYMRRDSIVGSAPSEGEWSGEAELGVRLPGRLVLRAGLERAPYLHTDASLDTTLQTETAIVRLDWRPPSGWLGELAWSSQRFTDDNVISGAYGWLLAPVLMRDAMEMRAGYAFGWQDSRESRFVQSESSTPGAGGLAGRYEPYYTPDRVRVHSATGAITLRGGALTFRADGSVPIRATEWVPASTSSAPVPPGPGPGTPGAGDGAQLREFQPWRVRGVLSAELARGTSAELAGEHTRTAYYAASSFAVRIVMRVLPRFADQER